MKILLDLMEKRLDSGLIDRQSRVVIAKSECLNSGLRLFEDDELGLVHVTNCRKILPHFTVEYGTMTPE